MSPQLSIKSAFSQHLPPSTIVKLVVAWAVVGAFLIGGHYWLHKPIDPIVAVICFIVIFATVMVAAFGVVHEADYLAHQLGEPYGTLILTLAVVSIEVILIAAVLLGPSENPMIGRDSIFAVMMIILNLVMGICLIVGGRRFGEQEYNSQGTIAYIAMTLVLAVVGLILPNTLSTGDGTFWPVQAVAFSILTIVLYGAFLLMQTRGYSRFFVQPELGSLTIRAVTGESLVAAKLQAQVDRAGVSIHSIILVAMMLPIVLLAHDLTLMVNFGITLVGAPIAFSGVIIAIIVFTPESMSAIRAALDNQLQRSINLCLGAFVSTVGLTLPAVLIVGLVSGKTVVMGVSPAETVMLLLTVALTALTFIGQRASALQGTLHLTLFAVFGVLLFAT